MSKLVIVESPAKAKSIKKYLGKGYEVTASMGHVRDLPAARLSVDIDNDFAPKYAIIKGKEKFVKELKKTAAESDAVYLATDPDREGEAISWHLATILGLNPDDANRVTFNEITKTGVTNGMEHPRAIDIDLVNAQQARRILDRLVGYKLSPFVSQKIRRGLSAGRVQSVAVRLIVDREKEIRAFVPEEYWSLDAKFTVPPSRKVFMAAFYGDETGKVKITSKEQADKYLGRLEGASYTVSNVKKGTRKRNPAPPFITSTLQQEASRRLGFQAKRTMKVAQELYEGVDVAGYGSMGLITYMRTDSLRISEEARNQGCAYIGEAFGKEYLPEKPVYFKSRANAQDGHEAIRPTVPSLTPEQAKASLTSDQYKIYNLVWKRFMASLMAPCIQNTVKAEIEANGCIFSASGYTVKFDGYTVLYDDRQDQLLEILSECEKAGHPDMVFEFCSTSKVSFAGSGIAAIASSKANLDDMRKSMTIQTIGYDKINQLRHVRYFKDINGIREHMKKHAAIMRPKFEAVLKVLDEELGGLGIGSWTKPNGGYFISFDAMDGCAKAIAAKCKEAGVTLTGAGATFPYKKDPKDSNIRIAPSFPTPEEMAMATDLFVLCVKMVSVDKLLENK